MSNLPKDALASDWEEYWKDTIQVKQWLSQQVSFVLNHLSFDYWGGNSVHIDGSVYKIKDVLSLSDLPEKCRSKTAMKHMLSQREELLDCIGLIEAYCASYKPPRGNSKPRYRVKAICVPMAQAA